MADVNRGNRPLSPHLQIYRPQMTSISSILMRISGNALIVAALMITWWFVAAAAGPDPAGRRQPRKPDGRGRHAQRLRLPGGHRQ